MTIDRDDPKDYFDGYLAGYVDGEGSFAVSIQRNPTCRLGLQLLPEFHVSQNSDRAEVLVLMQERFGCGYIRANSRKDNALVYVVRRRTDLLTRIIPFFERNPLLSSKHSEFETFARVARALDAGQHRSVGGFQELLELALSMNGGGRFRTIRWSDYLADAVARVDAG